MIANGPTKRIKRIVAAGTVSGAMLFATRGELTHLVFGASVPAAESENSAMVENDEVGEQVWVLVNKCFYAVKFLEKIDWASEHDKLLGSTSKVKPDYGVMRKSLKKLNDRYTRILTADQMEVMRKYDVSGVGLMLTQDDMNGDLVVSSDPVRGSAAGKAGIRRGDVIESINGQSIKGVDAYSVSERMQGPNGSVMRVGTSRREYELTITFEDTRSAVQSVALVPENDYMGYINLSGFSASSREDVADDLKNLRERGRNGSF